MNGMPLRLLLDHNVGHGVALALRQAGLDVLFVGDVDPHMPDAAILRWAVQERVSSSPRTWTSARWYTIPAILTPVYSCSAWSRPAGMSEPLQSCG